MKNVCVISTFQGTLDDAKKLNDEILNKFPGMVEEFDLVEMPYDKEGWTRVLVIANILDMEKMQEAMTASWVVEWDEKHNNTDEVYALEKMN
tara:strand:- start:2050 stop:2325 length:276 start_codon:yes stop_codon:yes gene_type:complete